MHHPPRHLNSHVSWWTPVALVSPTENILVTLKVHVSISTKFSGKGLGRRMDFPNGGYGAGPLPPALLAIQMCLWMAFGTSSPAVPGALAWGCCFNLVEATFLPAPQGACWWPWPVAGAASGRVRYTNLTFTCQTSGVLSIAWPCIRSSFCTTTYELNKKENNSDYELGRKKQSPANKWQWDKKHEWKKQQERRMLPEAACQRRNTMARD